MQDAIARKKAREMEIEIAGRIAAAGASKVAKKLGVNPSQITRWQGKEGLIEKMCKLLTALDFQSPASTVIIQGDATRDLAKLWIGMLDELKTKPD